MCLGSLLGPQLLLVLHLALELRHRKDLALAAPQTLPERRQQPCLAGLARGPFTPHQRADPRLDVVAQVQSTVLQPGDLGHGRRDLVFRLLVAEFEDALFRADGVRQRRVFALVFRSPRPRAFGVGPFGRCARVDVGVWMPWAVRRGDYGVPDYGF